MSNDPTVPPAQPTLETILERINALEERLGSEIKMLRAGQEELGAHLQSFRDEVMEKLAKVNRKFDVLNDELLEYKAEQKRHGKLFDELERKAS